MSNLAQLRIAAREIFDETLRAADPGGAVCQTIRLEGSRLLIRNTLFDLKERTVYSIAIGKAALPMAIALEEILGKRFAAGLIAGPIAGQPLVRGIATPSRKLSPRWKWFEGGHPLANETSLLAATEALALLERAEKERALIIFLVSGGGSAMIESPLHEDITLADLRQANSVLITCGASIAEINSVRRTFSAVKGGRLAARAPHCDQITLIISDVPSGLERSVASGPTLAPTADAPSAREVIARYKLRAQLPPAILRAIEAEPLAPMASEQDSTALRELFVLLDNRDAVEAAVEAARRRGFITEIAGDIADQPIEEGCVKLLGRLKETFTRAQLDRRNPSNSICLISGGEFACRVRGPGLGGRNLETALRLAIEYHELNARNHQTQKSPAPKRFVALCGGTDGIDGNSPAAGAIVDETTIQRAQSIGLDSDDFLEHSDAYSFFIALGDAIATGPTGTNVRDLRILMAIA